MTVNFPKSYALKSDKLDMKLTLRFGLIFLFFFTGSCSQRTVSYYRSPAANETTGCFGLMRGLLQMMGPEAALKKRITSVQKLVAKGEGIDEFRTLVDDLTENSVRFEDEELSSSAVRLHNIFTEYSEAVAANTEDYASFATRLSEVSQELIERQKSIAPGKRVVRNEEHFEMLRFMEDKADDLVSNFNETQRSDELLKTIIFKEFTSTTTEAERLDYQRFSWWVLQNKKTLDQASGSFEQFYQKEFPNFKKAFDKMNRSQRKAFEDKGREAILAQHNKLVKKQFTESYDENSFKEDTLLLLRMFRDLEPNFEEDRFLEWLFKEGELGEAKLRELKALAQKEGFDLELGDVLRQSYKRFASFQDQPPFTDKNLLEQTKEKIANFWNIFRKESRECASLDCVTEKSSEGWKKIFKSRFYKDSFSCLSHNPLALKTMAMDTALVWSALIWHYKGKEEEFQRFPYEIIVGGAVFAPMMAEANCRASFKNSLPFGGEIPKDEVFAGLLKKGKRSFNAFKGVAFRGFLASAGTLGLTFGIDHLFMAMGHSIAKPLGLNEFIALMPLTFLYHGVWLGIKNVAVINPIRYKVLPRFAEILTKKKGRNLNFWLLQTGLDFGAFYALLNYNQWESIAIYQEQLLPMLTGAFTAGVAIEHKREISQDGKTLDTFEGVTEDGISSHTVISEEEGEIKLESMDVDVPDSELEKWADEVLKGLPK